MDTNDIPSGNSSLWRPALVAAGTEKSSSFNISQTLWDRIFWSVGIPMISQSTQCIHHSVCYSLCVKSFPSSSHSTWGTTGCEHFPLMLFSFPSCQTSSEPYTLRPFRNCTIKLNFECVSFISAEQIFSIPNCAWWLYNNSLSSTLHASWVLPPLLCTELHRSACMG